MMMAHTNLNRKRQRTSSSSGDDFPPQKVNRILPQNAGRNDYDIQDHWDSIEFHYMMDTESDDGALNDWFGESNVVDLNTQPAPDHVSFLSDDVDALPDFPVAVGVVVPDEVDALDHLSLIPDVPTTGGVAVRQDEMPSVQPEQSLREHLQHLLESMNIDVNRTWNGANIVESMIAYYDGDDFLTHRREYAEIATIISMYDESGIDINGTLDDGVNYVEFIINDLSERGLLRAEGRPIPRQVKEKAIAG